MKNNSELESCGLILDISRQLLSVSQWEEALAFAVKKDVIGRHREMVEGGYVNPTEKRQALHTSLRSSNPASPYFTEVQQALNAMKRFAYMVRNGEWRGATGQQITDVINVGIGGSEMGPHAVYHALRDVNPKVKLHFLSAVDGILVDRILRTLNPETTLVVVSSKSFNTRETLANARIVDQWLALSGIASSADRAKHIVVVSAKKGAHQELNLPSENQFPLWPWVGGRFSVWGAVGLPLLIALGEDVFQELLDGAYEMDCHVLETSLEKNLPVTLALLSYWSHKYFSVKSHCLVPYDERLRLIVPWLQQLEMESLGKARDLQGVPIDDVVGQAVWGGMGNEAQHSFYQWLREGGNRTNICILWSDDPGHPYKDHHRVLVANARAQAEALVNVCRDDAFNAVTTLRMKNISAKTLGSLMAMYEHKTTLLATLYDINAFDQPGVEYGKKLCRQLETN